MAMNRSFRTVIIPASYAFVPIMSFAGNVQRRRPLLDFWTKEELNCERRMTLRRSKATAEKVCNQLKRLQRKNMRYLGLNQRKFDLSKRWGKRQLRKHLRMKNANKTSSSKCKLWYCSGNRPRDCIRKAMGRPSSRASVLTDLSRRSRTPIRFRSSPLLDKHGFKVEN